MSVRALESADAHAAYAAAAGRVGGRTPSCYVTGTELDIAEQQLAAVLALRGPTDQRQLRMLARQTLDELRGSAPTPAALKCSSSMVAKPCCCSCC